MRVAPPHKPKEHNMKGTIKDRAFDVAKEATDRGLWTVETGLAFMQVAAEDEKTVEFWETELSKKS